MPQFLRDRRFWRIAAQGIFVLALGCVGLYFWSTFSHNLQQRHLNLGFAFLEKQAGFSIGETLIPYKPTNSYSYALLVGLLNTLNVSLFGIIFATGLGVTIGVARLADNWLLRQLAKVYVEIFRNIPLLVQLFFLYAAFLKLPPLENQIKLLDLLTLNNRGITLLPLGLRLTPEFSALLIGLSTYTAAFIAEIVRGGIQSVSKGQWEAARALGFKSLQTLRLVVFPQALRVIIPSLTGQYLNLMKNSTLAVAIGYPELYSISSTTLNQTGQTVEVMLLMMTVYLLISLSIAGLTTLYNRKAQIVER